MSELGSGSGTSYPTSLDTDDILEVNSPNVGKTRARAEVVNDLAAAIVAIESELGTSPKGTAANVKTFLQTQHNLNGTHKTISTDTLSATGQITSTVVTGTAPFVVASTTEVANLKAATATLATTATTATTATNSLACSGNSATATTATKLTDGSNLIKTKVINIGAWDMDATATIGVAHGLTASNIRSVGVTVIIDSGTERYDIYYTTSGGAGIRIDSSNIILSRDTGGPFDNTNFNDTGINRGHIVITYVE